MNKITRGNSSQFFVAGELCRRGYSAVVTLGNTPNTDILCSNIEGTKFVHIQVKTFRPGDTTCSVGKKAEKDFGENFFWVLAGIPEPESKAPFQYYIIPSGIFAKSVAKTHKAWLDTPGKQGQPHNPTDIRTIHIPPNKSAHSWDISEYLEAWHLLEKQLN